MTGKKKKYENTKPEDALSGTVSVSAGIEGLPSLSISVKSRAVVAVDRILGGALGIPAEYIEGVRGRMEARNAAKIALIRAENEVDIHQLGGLNPVGQAAIRLEFSEAYRKLENKVAVCNEAIEYLKIEAEKKAEAQEQQGEQSSPEEDRAEMDEDWLNFFSSYAEKASSEYMRTIWGKILGGEIQKPGTFSPQTMRVLAEMNKDVATVFESFAKRAIGDSIPYPEIEGKGLDNKAMLLEQYGLVTGSSGLLSRILYPQNINGKFYCFLVDSEYLIQCLVENQSEQISYRNLLLTSVGMQLSALVDKDIEVNRLKAIADTFTVPKEIYLSKVTSNINNVINWELVRKLK